MSENYKKYKRDLFFFPKSITVLLLASAAVILSVKLYHFSHSNKHLMAEKSQLQQQNQTLKSEIVDLKNPQDGPQEHGALSVQGTQLVDQAGNPIRLRGISSHGIAWYPEYTNYQALKTLKEYGANVFRIAMYVAENDGYMEEPELNTKLLYSAIENSLAADLYTIVDWHIREDKNPNIHVEQAVEVLKEVAKRYPNEPGILYEICNEPNGDTTYQDIVEYANQVIPAIRTYSPNAVILVGTPKYCTTLSEAIETPLNYENIMYTYHYYAGISDCKYAREEITRGLESQLPVFISEWGLDGHEDTQQHWQDTKDFLAFLDNNEIGWVNWSLSNKDEGYSILKPDVTKLHGWEQEDFTETGRFVMGQLSQAKQENTQK